MSVIRSPRYAMDNVFVCEREPQVSFVRNFVFYITFLSIESDLSVSRKQKVHKSGHYTSFSLFCNIGDQCPIMEYLWAIRRRCSRTRSFLPASSSETNHNIIRANLEIIFIRITMLYFSVTRCGDSYKKRELNWIQLGLIELVWI